MDNKKKKKRKLKLWKYKALIQDGRKIKGKIAAYNKEEASKLLKQKGRFVSAVSDATPFTAEFMNPNKEDISIFFKDLANKISSGSDIKGILIGMKRLKYDFKIILMIERILDRIDDGTEFYIALEKAKGFGKDTIEIVKAGEKSGKLPLVLKELSVLYSEEAAIGKTLIKSLFKPIGMMIFAILIVVFIVPQMTEPIKGVYKEMNVEGKGLPLLTEIVLSSVEFVTGAGGILVLGVVIGLFVLFKVLYKYTFFFKKRWDYFMIWLPLFGTIRKKLFTYITALSFSTLYKSSINISLAFQMIADAQKNEALKDDLISVFKSLSAAKDLNVSIEQSLYLSDSLKDRISNGYEDGSLMEELEFAKTATKDDFNEYTKIFVSGVSSLIGFTVSLVVGIIIIAVYLPMFTMIGDVMGNM